MITVAVFAFALGLMFVAEAYPSRYLQWPARILPPLSMLQLIQIPFDFVTSIIWLGCAFAVLVSVLTLVDGCISFIYDRSGPLRARALRLVRPLLAIGAFGVSYYLIGLSIFSANRHALELALSIKSNLESHGECGKAYQEIQAQTPELSTRTGYAYGEFGTKYWTYVTCDEESQSFSVTVRLNIDSSFDIRGGANKALNVRYDHYSSTPTVIRVDETTDIDKLVKMELSPDEDQTN